MDDKLPLKGPWSGLHFKLWGPNDILMSEARHFKFYAQIDMDEYWCMHDRLSPKGM